jgi:hypothetical protein
LLARIRKIGTLQCCQWECEMMLLWKTVWRFLKKLKRGLSYDSIKHLHFWLTWYVAHMEIKPRRQRIQGPEIYGNLGKRNTSSIRQNSDFWCNFSRSHGVARPHLQSGWYGCDKVNSKLLLAYCDSAVFGFL